MHTTRLSIHGPDSFAPVPWRNGRGETLVLLSAPQSGSDEFAWRISIAKVDNDGPFSVFPGCNRTLLLLDGPGITLTHSGGQVDELGKRLAMAHFPGDIETVATLHDGPVRDFNIMYHREHCTTMVNVIAQNKPQKLAVDSDILLVYAVASESRVRPPRGELVVIDRHHLLRCDYPVSGCWHFSGGPALAIQISRRKTSGQ